MKLHAWITLLILVCSTTLWSKPSPTEKPLTVAVANFLPPFVVQSSKKQVHGFDIAMMTNLCKNLHRTCVFKPMRTAQLLNAVATHDVDMAVSAITITVARETLVDFSNPYLTSESQFLVKNLNPPETFSAQQLEQKTIGVVKDTVFMEQINDMSLKQASIRQFSSEAKLVDALIQNQIDVGLMDQQSAVYWQNMSKSAVTVMGKPMPYGLGFGIAMSPNNKILQKQINEALANYLQSTAYVFNYEIYFGYF